MLSVCRGPVQGGPARLEPLFTQPLRPDWEALFSHPGAFQRKPPAEAPRIRYTTLKTIHSAHSPHHVACRGCTLIILREQWACGIFLQKLHMAHVFIPLLTWTVMFSTFWQLSSITQHHRSLHSNGVSAVESDLAGYVCSKEVQRSLSALLWQIALQHLA